MYLIAVHGILDTLYFRNREDLNIIHNFRRGVIRLFTTFDEGMIFVWVDSIVAPLSDTQTAHTESDV